jgi:hypothetical protein
MAEPTDPAALSVASALKGLRTRAGLREERLHGTELALDTLTGLDSVRALVNGGESPERAIVLAVRAAASTLEPTMSIVVDASLGLELSAGLVPDTDLYAQDLGQRRGALLRNWDRLHELRSASPGRAPSPRALRLEVESEALAALALALTRGAGSGETDRAPGGPTGSPGPPGPRAGGPRLDGFEVSPAELRVFGAELTKTLRTRRRTVEQAAAKLAVPPAEVARWAAGKELPSESQARSLDEYLTARGSIQNMVIELRSRPDRPRPRLVAVPLPGPSVPTLLQTFGNVARALRACVVRDADGRPLGWPRDLRDLQGEATAASTAYGIKTMLLLEDGLAADLIPVAESLQQMALPAGGYAGREQSGPRPEATAAVLNALRRIAATQDLDAHIAQMERDLGEFEKCRPFILTTMLETSLLLKHDTKIVETLVDSLLAARRPYGDLLLWPEKAEPLLIDPVPSVAHTARAVRVLASVRAVRPSGQVQEALEQAVAWLTGQRDLHNAYEVLERPVEGGLEPVHVRHFTAAWVAKALVSAGVPAAHPSVSGAVAQIWHSYGGDTAALWAWDNGDLPIWMTFDAIEALRLANLAVPIPPGISH